MKPLLPTLKDKKRYVRFEVHGSTSREALMNDLQKNLGAIGLAEAGVRLIKFSGRQGILRVKAGSEAVLITALSLISGHHIIQTTKTSAIIKKVKEGV